MSAEAYPNPNRLDDARRALSRFFGYDSFRRGQETVIQAILEGRDVLGIMPTGAGKSICYQVPAVLLPGVTLVVSPLISLMKDQVDALTETGIPATYINSSLSGKETSERLRAIEDGRYKLVYIAPERLESERFLGLISRIEVPLIAVDEAHCVSQWGHDFRPSYMGIVRILPYLERRPIMAAFTATATDVVKEDILERLRLHAPVRLTTGYARDNLALSVVRNADKRDFLVKYIRERPGQSGIVYAATRREVEACQQHLASLGMRVGKYHAGLTEEERSEVQDAFLRDDLQIIVATNAFGMGIDKSNVRYVVHYNMPKNLEAYYQEAGRAGRDGEPGECVLLYSAADTVTQKFFIEQSEADEERKRNDYRLLHDMVEYANTSDCLQRSIVRYFGEEGGEPCGRCGNCTDTRELRDMTEEAKIIFSCVARMRQRFGVTLTAKVLRGANDAKIRQFGFDSLSVYGMMKSTPEKELVRLIHELIADGYLKLTDSQYPVVQLAERVRGVIEGTEKVLSRVEPEAQATKSRSRYGSGRQDGSHEPYDEALFERLRDLRKKLATREGVPPFIIFNDATLRDMCQRMPADERGMREVKGLGEAKYAKYGAEFLRAISDYKREG
ncbi:DNA helicase RecQ [Cohnella thailandensis]|uniref:DNA helicase RecQ n=1 Tax=Cohnella thailandensis TaxID=557557 RepID=A0A841SYD5_9BACL|nr:DNA helicase RecQ [Cohnella thailandensis]MBB6633771.1 DNA helicase RecQ [Cohnella thailandensis]MBP1976562.1 ATP-dependent DNA helicase RecQ [Cohnella thailandensis]